MSDKYIACITLNFEFNEWVLKNASRTTDSVRAQLKGVSKAIEDYAHAHI